MQRSRFLFLAGIAVLITVSAITALQLPDAWKPWAPLRLHEAPGVFTRYKLYRASSDDAVCRATLEQAHWQYAQIADATTAPGCGYRNAVRVERMQQMAVSEPFAVSCREALSLALWELHVLQPAALRHFGAPVSKIEHFGSYSCRSVYGRPNARMSRHATADAFDVAGFVIDGSRVRIISAWHSRGRDGQFLREVHDGACDFFDTVLGPEYNAAHSDHLHLDRGSFRLCR